MEHFEVHLKYSIFPYQDMEIYWNNYVQWESKNDTSRIRELFRGTTYVLTDNINRQSLFVFFIFHVFGLIK